MLKSIYTFLFLALSIQAFSQTVVDIIVNSPEHNTLEAAVVAAELVDDLGDPNGSFTVFAPTDAAFDLLPAGTVNTLLQDPTGDLAKILLYHVVGTEAFSTDLSNDQVVTTLLGQGVIVNISNNEVFINGAKVSIANIDASNGVVHVLDAVLSPAATVVDVVVESPNHTTLEAAVIAAELAGTLSGDGPFTVFAPTDAAFDLLPAGTVDALLNDPTGDLAQILLYHVLGAEVLSTDLSNNQVATTLQQQDVAVTIDGNEIMINDSKVSVANIRTLNGVVHVIDAVLLPDLTSISDLDQVNMKVMPNPASDQLTIELPREMLNQEVNAQIIGMDGRIVKNWTINNSRERVDVQRYPAGTYLLLLTTDGAYAKRTIVVN